jgi:hypothetical protein
MYDKWSTKSGITICIYIIKINTIRVLVDSYCNYHTT